MVFVSTMEYTQGSLVPRIINDKSPLMADLYQRRGAGDGTDPQRILDGAENTWNTASSIHDRVEAAQLLMGRRIDGSEIRGLPHELTSAIFDALPFEIAVNGVTRAIESGRL
jgi:hypothetical protein